MTERKMIAVNMDTYNAIEKLANENGRTLGGQVEYMTKWEVIRQQLIDTTLRAELAHTQEPTK